MLPLAAAYRRFKPGNRRPTDAPSGQDSAQLPAVADQGGEPEVREGRVVPRLAGLLAIFLQDRRQPSDVSPSSCGEPLPSQDDEKQ